MRLRALPPVVALAVVVGACASPVPPPLPTLTPVATPSPRPIEEPSPAPTRQALPALQPVRPAASPSPVALPLAVLVGRSGGDLRVGLDLALEESLYLLGAALDAAYAGRLDELAGTSRTLDQTSATLAAIVGAVRGASTQASVLDALRSRTASAIDDARAHRAPPSRDEARDPLVNFLVAQSATLSNAANSRQMTPALRTSAARADDLARPLAADLASLVTSDLSGPTDDPEIELRLSLDRLMQEHVLLAGRVVSAAADHRGDDAQAALLAGDASADEFGQRMSTLYGEPLGARLADLLKDHARAEKRLAEGGDRDQALNTLDRVRSELDTLLASANPLLPRGIGIAQQRLVDQELTAAADAFAARDWGSGYGHLHQAARQSQRLADLVARASVDRFPSRFTSPVDRPTQSPAPAE